MSGPVTEFDPGVELAAYRIVQEALTNARRHAPSAAVDVELCYADDALRLRVRDNGPGPEGSPETTGREPESWTGRRPGGRRAWTARDAGADARGGRHTVDRARAGRRVPRRGGLAGETGGRRAAEALGPIVPSGGGPVSEET